MKRIILFIFLTLLMISCVYSAPNITDWDNSKTNDQNLYPIVGNGELVLYNFTANESVGYTWYVDGEDTGVLLETLGISFTTPFYHNITIEVSNANGTDSLTWYPVVEREIASTTSTKQNETAYNNMLNSFNGETDFESFLLNSTIPFTDILGSMFFVVIFGMYFAMQWNRQENILNGSIVGLIVGIVLFAFLPEDFANSAIPLIILGATATIYSLYRERWVYMASKKSAKRKNIRANKNRNTLIEVNISKGRKEISIRSTNPSYVKKRLSKEGII